MMNTLVKRLIAIICAATALFAAVAVLNLVTAGADVQSPVASKLPGFDYAHSNFDLAEARAFTEFPLYFVGTEFHGLPLTAINRRAPDYESAAPGRVNYVSFKYGTCIPRGDTGCPAPLEVQVWSACDRNLSMYVLLPDRDGPTGPETAEPYPHERLTLRGVPAAFFDARTSLEVYTGAVTIALWGNGEEQLLTAAQSLRSVTANVMPHDALPSPVPGALEGHLPCS